MISLIIVIAVAGVLVWLIESFIPMPPIFKTAIRIVAAVCLVLYILQAFGLLGHADIPLPQVR